MNRRYFLKWLAGLAAAMVAPIVPAALVQTEQQRFTEMLETGLVENQTFYLDGPIVLENVSNLVIRYCQFIFGDQASIRFSSSCRDVWISDSRFDNAKITYGTDAVTIEFWVD